MLRYDLAQGMAPHASRVSATAQTFPMYSCSFSKEEISAHLAEECLEHWWAERSAEPGSKLATRADFLPPDDKFLQMTWITMHKEIVSCKTKQPVCIDFSQHWSELTIFKQTFTRRS
jgi:hypothetical protein